MLLILCYRQCNLHILCMYHFTYICGVYMKDKFLKWSCWFRAGKSMSFTFLKGNRVSLIQHVKDRDVKPFYIPFLPPPIFLLELITAPNCLCIFSDIPSKKRSQIMIGQFLLFKQIFFFSSLSQDQASHALPEPARCISSRFLYVLLHFRLYGKQKVLTNQNDTPGFSVTLCYTEKVFFMVLSIPFSRMPSSQWVVSV